MTTIRLQLENNTFEALKKYAKKKRMSIQEVLHNLVAQVTFDNDNAEDTDTPSWKRPLPHVISEIMPIRKKVSFEHYEDYRNELEKQVRDAL